MRIKSWCRKVPSLVLSTKVGVLFSLDTLRSVWEQRIQGPRGGASHLLVGFFWNWANRASANRSLCTPASQDQPVHFLLVTNLCSPSLTYFNGPRLAVYWVLFFPATLSSLLFLEHSRSPHLKIDFNKPISKNIYEPVWGNWTLVNTGWY